MWKWRFSFFVMVEALDWIMRLGKCHFSLKSEYGHPNSSFFSYFQGIWWCVDSAVWIWFGAVNVLDFSCSVCWWMREQTCHNHHKSLAEIAQSTGGARGHVGGAVLHKLSDAQMTRSKPSIHFGKMSLGVRVPSKQTDWVELIPSFVAQNGAKWVRLFDFCVVIEWFVWKVSFTCFVALFVI